jgi:hypothetical protein
MKKRLLRVFNNKGKNNDFFNVGLNLDYIHTNSWLVVMISALKGINLPEVIDWLIKKSKK